MASCSTNVCDPVVVVASTTMQNVFDPDANTVDGCQITSALNAMKSHPAYLNKAFEFQPSANSSIAKPASNNGAKKTMKAAANKAANKTANVTGATIATPSVEALWNMRQKTLNVDNIKNTKGKLWLIYGHGLQDINNFFVVPEGYYLYFDNMSGEQGVDNIEKADNDMNSTNIEGNLVSTQSRHLILFGNNFIHMYQPGDLINQHQISFSPYSAGGDNTLPVRLLTGIIPPSEPLDPEQFTYSTSREPKCITKSEYYNKKIKVDEKFFKKEVNGHIDISINQNIALSDLFKTLNPGHYFIKICRSWPDSSYNPASNPVKNVAN